MNRSGTGVGQIVPEDKLLNSEEYHIKFEGVGLTLPDGLQIMKGVSGEFMPKRTCAIMGPSGAGIGYAVSCPAVSCPVVSCCLAVPRVASLVG